jgi:hypothetical protein
MTLVRIDNSNNSDRPDAVSTPRYIEFLSTKVEWVNDHEVINFNYPYPPGDWVSGGTIVPPQKLIFDLKQCTQSFQINGKIDIDCNKNSSWVTVALADVYTVANYIMDIANTGGIVQFHLVNSTGTNTYKGVITALKFTDDAQDQIGTASPTTMDVQFTFLIGLNVES